VNETYRRERIVVNDSGPVPLDESAACYKSSSEVVQAIVEAGLAEIEVRLWPLSSIKGDDRTSSIETQIRRTNAKQRSRKRDAARRAKRE
jgi:tRNA-splicing ligase RtcB